MKSILLGSVALIVLTGCGPLVDVFNPARGEAETTTTTTQATTTQTTNEAKEVKAKTVASIGEWGVDIEGRDMTTQPGDDFFRYAGGQWLDAFDIPADLTSYGSFLKLHLKTENDIHAIVQDLAATEASAGSLEQKVGDHFEAWMNTDRLDELGAAPLKPYLDEIAAISTQQDLMAAFADLENSAPFGVGIIPSPMDPTQYVAFVSQGGLGLPNRDYYLKDDETFQGYRAGYLEYMANVMTLAGIEGAADKAAAILALETRLAEAHWTPAESRNISKIINPMTIEQMSELSPEFDWSTILQTMGLSEVPIFIVAETTAIDAAGDILADTSLETWKDYLTLHFIRRHATSLSSEFDTAHFDFFGKKLRGTEEQRERWKRGVNLINGSLGEAVGQIYIDRHFPPAAKTQMDELVANLTAAFAERLEQNAWMDDETREKALIKLAAFEPKIGYTAKWTDYSNLAIKKGALLDNSIAANKFAWQKQVNKLGGPVDRVEWPYPPQTVNASYNPLLNQITFPAGILQPPFFDPKADAAVNYGAIGAVIGHEIGHGFDDQGRLFDATGRYKSWWSEEADTAFEAKAAVLGEQYDAFSPVEGLNVNGELTMGENIGDLGGLQMAYAAYHRYLDANHGGEAPVIDGLTGDQRFFLAWAQVWRGKMRDDALRNQLLTDPHSPLQYRVNGVVRNMDEWYEAFGVTEDSALYIAPEKRVRIW